MQYSCIKIIRIICSLYIRNLNEVFPKMSEIICLWHWLSRKQQSKMFPRSWILNLLEIFISRCDVGFIEDRNFVGNKFYYFYAVAIAFIVIYNMYRGRQMMWWMDGNATFLNRRDNNGGIRLIIWLVFFSSFSVKLM